MRAGAGLEIYYDDNVNLSESQPEPDVILRPSATLTSIYPLSEKNALTFDLDLGYLGYLNHPALSRLTVQPGSIVALDLYVGAVRLNVHNQLSYLDDPLATGPVSNSSEFGGLYNTSGASAHWQLDQLTLEGGYDFSVFQSSLRTYNYLDRLTHSVFARVDARLVPEFDLGIEASAASTSYRSRVLNDNQNASVGPFFNWQVSPHLNWVLRGGYSFYTFQATGSLPPQADTGSFYFQSDLNHQVNERLSQSLSVLRSFEQGVSSELLDRWQIQHSLDWQFIRQTPLHTVLFYENGTESGGAQPERYVRYGASAAFSRLVARSLTIRIGYDWVLKHSELPGRDYTDQRLTVSAVMGF